MTLNRLAHVVRAGCVQRKCFQCGAGWKYLFKNLVSCVCRKHFRHHRCTLASDCSQTQAQHYKLPSKIPCWLNFKAALHGEGNPIIHCEKLSEEKKKKVKQEKYQLYIVHSNLFSTKNKQNTNKNGLPLFYACRITAFLVQQNACTGTNRQLRLSLTLTFC